MNKNNIEAIYPLSPVQQGMLFHSLYTPENDPYVMQMAWTWHKKLDVSLFEQAWQHVVDRHSVLRTIFIWQGQGKPNQVVRQRIKFSVQLHDWHNLSEAEQRTRLEEYLRADRTQGFDFFSRASHARGVNTSR